MGTALLNNARRDLGDQSPSHEELVHYLGSVESAKASAEANVLGRLALTPDDEIILLRSDTPDGEACARALKSHFSKVCACSERNVKGLAFDDASFQRALTSFVSMLVDVVTAAKGHGRDVLINAAGGFKAQFACSGLVGLLFRVPVYYIHEDRRFSRLIEIPPVPIAWDSEVFLWAEDFFAWLTADLRSYEEVQMRLKAFDAATQSRIASLLEIEDGYCFLSSTGTAFFAAFQRDLAAEPSTVFVLSAVAERQLKDALSDSRAREAYRGLVARIGSPAVRAARSGRKENSDLLFYPGGGATDRHVVFAEEGGKVFLAEFFLNHKDRDAKLDRREIMRALYSPARESSLAHLMAELQS